MQLASVHKAKPAPSTPGSAPSWIASAQRSGVIQRRSDGQSQPASVPPIVHEVLRSPGQPLDAATRAYMEPRFGHDFSKVRVHADGKAAGSACAVNALAYTVGRDVVFGEGQYRPANREGRHLLAHELTHVVQQSAPSDSSALHLDNPNSAEEGIAQRASKWILSGGSEQIAPVSAASRLQRQVMAANQPAKRELNGCRILFVKGTTTFASPPQSDECLSLLATYLKPDPDYKAVPYKTTLLGFGSGEDGDKAGIKSMSTARAEAVKQWLMTSVSGISAEQIEVHGEGADFSSPQQGVVVVLVKQVAAVFPQSSKTPKPCFPFTFVNLVDWEGNTAVLTKDSKASLLQVQQVWKPCHTTIQIVLKSADSEDPSRRGIMNKREAFLKGVLIGPKIPPSAFLPTIINFNQPGWDDDVIEIK